MQEEFPKLTSEELSPEEKFAQTYEGAKLEAIIYDELPPEAVEHFENNSEKFISPKAYTPRNFSHIYLLTHPDGSKTYIGEQTKNYGEGKDTEELAFFMDFIDGQPVGHGGAAAVPRTERVVSAVQARPAVGQRAQPEAAGEDAGRVPGRVRAEGRDAYVLSAVHHHRHHLGHHPGRPW